MKVIIAYDDGTVFATNSFADAKEEIDDTNKEMGYHDPVSDEDVVQELIDMVEADIKTSFRNEQEKANG